MSGLAAITLEDLAIAVLALLLGYSFYLVLSGAANVLEPIPAIGPPIANALRATGTFVQQINSNFFHSQSANAVHLFAYLWSVRVLWRQNAKNHQASGLAIGSIIKVRLPNLHAWAFVHILEAISAANNYTNKVTTNLQAWTAFQVGGAKSYAHTQAADVQAWAAYHIGDAELQAHVEDGLVKAYAAFGIAGARQYTKDVTAELQLWAAGQDQQTQAWAQSAIGALSTWTAGQLTQLRSDTQSAIGAAVDSTIATIHNETTTAVHDIWAPTATEAEKVIGAVQGLWPGVIPQDATMPTTVPLTEGLALRGVLSAVGALSTYADECGIPTCRNLGGFGRELQNLLSLFGEGALLAFLIEAVAHPETVAHDIADIGGAMASGAETIVKDVVQAA